MIVIFIMLLLAGAYGVRKIFGYTIEEGLFINIFSTIVLLLITGLIGILNIGFYLILAVMIMLSAAGISIAIKNKTFDIYEIITPGMAVLTLSCLFYFVTVRNIGFHRWDEASHWGTAVKHMYLTNKMYFGLQTMGLPSFSYFMTRIAGYSEGLVYLSRWIFMWSGIVILMKDIKWKSWYLAAIGWALSACIVNIAAAEPMYYMDKPLGVLAGVLIAYILLDNSGEWKKDILVLLGLLVLPHIKDAIGMEMAVFVLIFSFASGIISLGIKNKRFWISRVIMIMGITSSYFVSTMFKSDKLIGYYNIERMPDFDTIISLMATKSSLLVYGVFAISAVFLILSFKSPKIKSIKHAYLIKYSSLTCMLVSLYLIVKKVILSIYRSFEPQGALYFKNALRKMFYESFYGKPTFLILLFVAAFAIILYFLYKNKSLKTNIFNILAIATVLGHGIVLALLYAMTAEDWQGNTLSSYTRYYMSTMMIVSFIILAQILYKKELFEKMQHRAAAIAAVSVLLLNTFPITHDMDFLSYDVSYKSTQEGLRSYAMQASEDINSVIPEDADVFIVCQNNGAEWVDQGLPNWIHYYILPRETNFIAYSFGEKYTSDDKLTEKADMSELHTRISGYDYIYIDNADDKFYGLYGGFFGELPDKDRAIYENTEGTFKLIWQGTSIR